jgi:hypothetical protein
VRFRPWPYSHKDNHVQGQSHKKTQISVLVGACAKSKQTKRVTENSTYTENETELN